MRAVVVVGTLAALALILVGFSPVDVVRIYLLGLVVGVGALVAGQTLSRFDRLEREAARRRRMQTESETPAFFERAIRRVELANGSGVYLEQLRPRLREIAEQRLAARGLRLNSDEARKLLGDEAWVALDRPQQGDRFAPPPEGRLSRVITALERI